MRFDDSKQLVDRCEVQAVGRGLDRFPVDREPDQVGVGGGKKDGQIFGRGAIGPLRDERAVAESDQRRGGLRRRLRLLAARGTHGLIAGVLWLASGLYI